MSANNHLSHQLCPRHLLSFSAKLLFCEAKSRPSFNLGHLLIRSNMIGYYCLFVSVRPMCHQITVARYFTFSDNLLKISHDTQYYSLATTRSVCDVIAITPFTCTAHQHTAQHSTATSASKWLINIIFHSLSQLFARSKSGFFKEIADPVVCECHHGLTTTVAGVCPNIWHTVKQLVLIIVLEALIWLELLAT